MHPNQQQPMRKNTSRQPAKTGVGLAFRPGQRRPRRGAHRKIHFPTSMARVAGHPVPPHVRLRPPAEQARPLSETERLDHYGEQNGGTYLTSRQAKRNRWKAQHAAARPRRLAERQQRSDERQMRQALNWMAEIMGRRK